MSEAAKVFTDIYERKTWGDGSGGGSVPEHLPEYRALVGSLIYFNGYVKRVLDIGCGLGWLAASIDWHGAWYIGMDVVPSAVEHTRKLIDKGNGPTGIVIHGDALADELPPADLVLLKEVTQHLDNASVLTLIDRLRTYPLVLHTSVRSGVGTNAPIAMGQTRGVDLTLSPFGLPCETMLTYSVANTQYLCQLWRPNA